MTSNADRIAIAKKIQETCDCRVKGFLIHVGGGSWACLHYSFAIIFPELLEFWKDERDPLLVAPTSSKKFLLACKKKCGSVPYGAILSNYIKRVGCEGCTGQGRIIGLNADRTVKENAEMMLLWSPNNTSDPSKVSANSTHAYCIWRCLEDPNHEWPANTDSINKGTGCPICWNHGRYSIDEIKEKFSSAHDIKYSYDWSTYVHVFEKMSTICPSHGEFNQRPIDHYNGSACRKCSVHPDEFSEVLKRFRILWGDTYEYDEDTYVSSGIPMTIICSIHGKFRKTPDSHSCKKRPSGCQTCSREQTDSAGVRYISRMLTLMSTAFLREEYFDNLRSDKNRVLYSKRINFSLNTMGSIIFV